MPPAGADSSMPLHPMDGNTKKGNKGLLIAAAAGVAVIVIMLIVVVVLGGK
jgi:hypothetical protein